MNTLVPFLGRIFIGALFLKAGFEKLIHFDDSSAYLNEIAGEGMSPVWMGAAIVLAVIGGISLLMGWKARMGAFLLVLYIVIATILFHFDFSDPQEIGNVFRNMALLGGLLMCIANGAGKWSMDGQ